MKINQLLRSIYFFNVMLLICPFAKAQQPASYLRKGNELYRNGKYSEAEIEYRKGLEKQSKSYTGNYNLANSLYKQKKYKEAEAILDTLGQFTTDKNQLASVYHNLGNSFLSNKDYANSVETYKKALKLKPDAEDTRYNLAYALKKMQQQQQQQKQQQQKSPQQQQQQDKQQKNKQEQQKPEEKKQNINRDEAERMLNELNRNEKELRKKQEEKPKKAIQAGSGKDW